jgi:hypothetical protein
LSWTIIRFSFKKQRTHVLGRNIHASFRNSTLDYTNINTKSTIESSKTVRQFTPYPLIPIPGRLTAEAMSLRYRTMTKTFKIHIKLQFPSPHHLTLSVAPRLRFLGLCYTNRHHNLTDGFISGQKTVQGRFVHVAEILT